MVGLFYTAPSLNTIQENISVFPVTPTLSVRKTPQEVSSSSGAKRWSSWPTKEVGESQSYWKHPARVHQQKGPSSQAGTSVLGRACGRIGTSAALFQPSALAAVLHLFIPFPWTSAANLCPAPKCSEYTQCCVQTACIPPSSLCQAFSVSWFKAPEMLAGSAGQRDGLGGTCCACADGMAERLWMVHIL